MSRRIYPCPGRGKPCRHCRRNRINCPRRLCHACYYVPAIREQYPTADSKSNRRGIEDFFGPSRPPPEATDGPPGSPRKIEVMRERAARGECVFRDGDDPGWEDGVERPRPTPAAKVVGKKRRKVG